MNIDTALKVETGPRGFSYPKWVELWDTYARKPFISY